MKGKKKLMVAATERAQAAQQEEGQPLASRIVSNITHLFTIDAWYHPPDRTPRLVSDALVIPFIGPLRGPPPTAKQRAAIGEVNRQLPRWMPRFPCSDTFAGRLGFGGPRLPPKEICDQLEQIE